MLFTHMLKIVILRKPLTFQIIVNIDISLLNICSHCYSFDVRGKHLSEARHWSAPEVFGPRAHFSTAPPPAALLVRDVKRRDEGVYRCRVDFRNTQTTSFRYNLTVVGKWLSRGEIVMRWEF